MQEDNNKLEDKRKNFTAAASLKGGECNGTAAALQRPYLPPDSPAAAIDTR